MRKNVVKNSFFEPVPGGESIVIKAVDGTRGFSNETTLFSYIDSDFENWGLNEKGQATKEKIVDVRQLKKDAMFSQMFGDPKSVCLSSEHQAIEFIESHRDLLCLNGLTFIPFRSLSSGKGNFFVACVIVYSDDELRVDVRPFGNSDVWGAGFWGAGYRRRVVVPRLA
ncbi:MAG: hypothetical protein Q7T79_02685 [bacterium]|nr:hypothetical protein [bacterium]